MSSTKFKLSVVTTALLSAFAAKAETVPMYNVVPVDVSEAAPEVKNSFSYNEVYGVAIQPATVEQMADLTPMGCFSSENQTVDCANDFALAGEARVRVDSVSMLDEAPFAMDASFGYIEDYDSFKSYCYRELLYATCESWASTYWNAWRNVLNGVPNIQAFVENSEYVNSDFDNHITALLEDGTPIGMQSNSAANSVYAPRRDITPVPLIGLEEGSSIVDYRSWNQLTATNGYTYVVGSSSTVKNNTNGDHFVSKASVWSKSTDDTEFSLQRLDWPSGKDKDGERLAQGSIRDIAELETGEIYAVGYNTYDSSNNYYGAYIFKLNEETNQFANTSRIAGAEIKNSDNDVVYSNTQLVSVNNQGVAIGESKLYGSRPENGAAANKPFVVETISSSPTAKYLQSYGQSLFFSGVGADLGAINNLNEIVGSIDATQARENDGQPRRRRGFIYTVPQSGDLESPRQYLFRNKAWLLDDLTNDGNPSGLNNQYRIIAASDINDAGVISATAIFCEGGYDDTTHNSYCGDRQGVEQVIAVKLVPNQLEDANFDGEEDLPTIIPRGVNDPPVERQGAGFGWFFLAALGFLGFRRK
ncbi:DUF3466 family protein [Vibrio astriarenae]